MVLENTNPSQVARSAKAAGDGLRNSLAGIRTRILDLQDRRSSIEGQPASLEEAFDRLERWADVRSEWARSRLPTSEMFLAPPTRFQAPGVYSEEHAAMAFLKPLIVDALRKDIEHVFDNNPGISAEARAAALAAIDLELLDAELTEESIIRSAESAGFQIARRADADPRAVLADDRELP
jgi:hypothetical protein